MYKRHNYGSGAVWESMVGYSRAVRVGNVVEVSGTVATDAAGNISGDEYSQTKLILQKIETALKNAGAGLQHIVRTRIYVINMANWQAVGRAHGETFAHIQPCTSMVEVAALIDSRCLVEIEATAIITE